MNCCNIVTSGGEEGQKHRQRWWSWCKRKLCHSWIWARENEKSERTLRQEKATTASTAGGGGGVGLGGMEIQPWVSHRKVRRKREILKFGEGEVEEKEHDKRERGYMWVLIV